MIGRIVNGLKNKKSDAAYIKALEEAGDILLMKGMDPNRLRALLKRGTAKQITAKVREYLDKPAMKAKEPYAAASIVGGAAELPETEQEVKTLKGLQTLPGVNNSQKTPQMSPMPPQF